MGGILRLATHDAMSYSKYENNGGMDGCLQFDDIVNRGLEKYRDLLQPVYEHYSSLMSRADFWALASLAVIEAAGGPRIPFQWGRVDAAHCPEDGGRLPDPTKGHGHVMKLFTRLGFTAEEAVALMGAHTIEGLGWLSEA
ncbi:hypothetical protein CYMTET_49243 [Cymbomonas tetramitiformis]|uniref:L-ascorbate peroxidase n=1 Tax=Cymbomonas tetramitiformis TaxID=36881 RepID=A0AAE0EUW9_9CHLO|nr:hypothetical protein CYMTET_49243 [Cymbomonas tetramitiformis]